MEAKFKNNQNLKRNQVSVLIKILHVKKESFLVFSG